MAPEALASALGRAARALFEPLVMDPAEPPIDLDEYIALVSATTGLGAQVITHQLELLAETLRDLAERALVTEPSPVDSLAVVLPSNAIAVNRAWLPALACGARVALKPGASDPFTPHRLVAALVASGFPADTFSVYPSAHEATGALISLWPRVQLFGDAEVVARYGDDARVQVNGPGKSAVILGAEVDLEAHLDALVEGIALHEGRSCLNTSSICTLAGPEVAHRLAEALAERLKGSPSVALADPERARMVGRFVEEALEEEGACDMSAAARGGLGLIDAVGEEVRLRPTIVYCEGREHPLARIELPFVFASVSALDEASLVAWLGGTLSVATLGLDEETASRLESAPRIERSFSEAPHSLQTSMAGLHLERMQRLLS